MATVGTILKSSTGKNFRLVKELAKGGEGTVFTTDDPTLVIKVYHKPDPVIEKKLLVMLAHPLEPKADGVHLLIAWPQAVVYENGSFSGYAMPFVKDTHPIYTVARNNPRHIQDCHEIFPSYDWRYSLMVAYNLAFTVSYIHKHNYVVGDMNSNNIAIHGDGSVTLLDVDSFDITDPDSGARYPCNVGICEFLAPELQGRDLRRANFTKHTDEFALAVHIFILLMNNCHPFTLRQLSPGEMPFQNVTTLCQAKQSKSQDQAATNIVEGNCVFLKQIPGYGIPSYAPMITMLPRTIQDAFRWTFDYNKTDFMSKINGRATADQWRVLLYDFYMRTKGPSADLIRCSKNPEHFYLAKRGFCEFCAAEERFRLFSGGDFVPGASGARSAGPVSASAQKASAAQPWVVEPILDNGTHKQGETIWYKFRVQNGPAGQKHTFSFAYVAPDGTTNARQKLNPAGVGEELSIYTDKADAGTHCVKIFDGNRKLAENSITVAKKRGWFF